MPVFVEACQPSAIHGCCEKRCCCCWKSHFYGTVKLVFRVWNGDDDNEDVLLLDQSFKFGGKGMRCVGTGFGFCFTNQVCKDFGSQFSTRQTGLDSWLPKCTFRRFLFVGHGSHWVWGRCCSSPVHVFWNGSALRSLAPKASQLLTQRKMWQVVLKGFSAGSVLEPG